MPPKLNVYTFCGFILSTVLEAYRVHLQLLAYLQHKKDTFMYALPFNPAEGFEITCTEGRNACRNRFKKSLRV